MLLDTWLLARLLAQVQAKCSPQLAVDAAAPLAPEVLLAASLRLISIAVRSAVRLPGEEEREGLPDQLASIAASVGPRKRPEYSSAGVLV